MERKQRRSSIVLVENEETKRNDEILRQLELDMDDDDSSDDLADSRNHNKPRQSYDRNSEIRNSTQYTFDYNDPLSMPCKNIRNYLKRANEIKEVNERYRAMIQQQREERARRHIEKMETDQMEEEELEEEEDNVEETEYSSLLPGEFGR